MEEKFATRLRIVRIRRGLREKDLAAAVGCKSTSISEYENGTAEPMMYRAAQIAKALGVSLDYLAGLQDDPEDRSYEQ